PRCDRRAVTAIAQGRDARVSASVRAELAYCAEALVNAGVDALVIAAATPAHAPLLNLAADARLPAFCEQPIALDLPATDDVIEHVQRAGTLVQIGFQRRFDAGYRAAQA